VTISGANFGSSQGGSSVTFNGVPATVSTWGSSSIDVSVPTGATTGNVTVTVSGAASNEAAFTVDRILYNTPQTGAAGTLVTIGGSGFGATQSSSTVLIGSTEMTVFSWSDTQIQAVVASDTTTGSLSVHEGSLVISGPTFTVGTSFPYIPQPQSLSLLVGET